MKELSLNILDVAENSVKAKAAHVKIIIEEKGNTLTLEISDDGCGMTKEQCESVTDPFFTTRTTRKIGMGIPFLKLACEQTGGEFSISSRSEAEYPDSHGTVTRALFYTDSIDFTPLGDIITTVTTLIMGSPGIDWYFEHTKAGRRACVDTAQIREVLGSDVPLNSYEVIEWIKGSLEEEYALFI